MPSPFVSLSRDEHGASPARPAPAGATKEDAVRDALEPALQLIQMVVVVPGHDRNKLIDCDPSLTAHPGALPLNSRQRAQELKRLVALAPKCRECLAPVAPIVLPVLTEQDHGLRARVPSPSQSASRS